MSTVAKGEWLTRRISWSVPLLFPLDDDHVVSSPKQSTDQRTMVTGAVASPIQSRSAQRGEIFQTEAHLYTSFQTLSILLEERGYIRTVVLTMPLESRLKEFKELIGEVIGYSLFPGWE